MICFYDLKKFKQSMYKVLDPIPLENPYMLMEDVICTVSTLKSF